jgi:hypothetical protein
MEPISEESTAIPQQANPIPPVEISKPKNHLVSVLLIIIILFSLSAVIFFAYQNMQLKNQITTLQTTPSITPKPTANSTVIESQQNWKAYHIQSNNLSFRYPANLKVLPVTDSRIFRGDEEYWVALENSDQMYLDIILYKSTELPERWWITEGKNIFLELSKGLLLNNPPIDVKLSFNTLEQTTVGGKNAIHIQVVSNVETPYLPTLNNVRILQNNGYIIMVMYHKFSDNSVETSEQILSTFTFADAEQSSNLPTGWTTYNGSTCGVTLPIPPRKADADNRTWQTGTLNESGLLGFFKGKGEYVMHRNSTDASGFISGYVDVSCGQDAQQKSLDALSDDFQEYLKLQAGQNEPSMEVIVLTSNTNGTKWGMPTKIMTFNGGMFDPNQEYYLLVNDGMWYLITKNSDSPSSEINQQTNQIFDLLTFTR